MTQLLNNITDAYNYVIDDIADPRTQSYFLTSSPLPVLGIIFFYHYFIFSLGPRLMKDRLPFKLDKALVVYNFIQILVCFYMVIQGFRHVLFKFSLVCEPIDYSPSEFGFFIARHIWLYFMVKILDLLDTVFFILRKKHRQVTFLHVYHHTGMVVLGWIATKYVAGGHGVLLGILNSLVHVFMYFYYLLSSWDKNYQKNVWWKKHLTQLQIVQFMILTVHFGQLLFQPSCSYPKWISWVYVPQNILMAVLFINFYIQEYVTPKKERDTQSKLQNGVASNDKKQS